MTTLVRLNKLCFNKLVCRNPGQRRCRGMPHWSADWSWSRPFSLASNQIIRVFNQLGILNMKVGNLVCHRLGKGHRLIATISILILLHRRQESSPCQISVYLSKIYQEIMAGCQKLEWMDQPRLWLVAGHQHLRLQEGHRYLRFPESHQHLRCKE